jgi:hypothetical protein
MAREPKLSDKSRAFDLYACQTTDCNVMTYIKVVNCPSCGLPGSVLRFTDTFEKGQPPDPRSRSYSGGETTP